MTLEGYIEPIKGTKRPVLYKKGQNSAILDEVLVKGLVKGDNGGGLNYPQNPTPPLNYAIPTGEAHINGRYIFPVIRVGDLCPLKVGTGSEKRTVEIFERVPVQLKAVRYFRGKVQLDSGHAVTVQYWETNEPSLHVWPDPVQITAGTIGEAPEVLEERAVQVTYVLSKWGGWRFGPPRFSANDEHGIHYAIPDPLIMSNFPPGYRPDKESGFWVDGTPGPRSCETGDPAKAQAVLDFHGRTMELRDAIQRDHQDIVSLRQTAIDDQMETLRLLVNTTDIEKRLAMALNQDVMRSYLTNVPQGVAEAKTNEQQEKKERYGSMYQ